MARATDKKTFSAGGVSVTGVASAAPSHAVTQAMGCHPVPAAGGSLQAGMVVLGTGMNPDLRLLGGEAV